MRPDGIVLTPPRFDQNLGLLQRVENFAVQELIAQPSVEAFDVAVLPGAAWRDVCGLCANASDPRLHRFCDEFRPVI